MSCYNNERGTIIIPRASWPTFRKTVIQAWNDHNNEAYDLALQLYQKLKTQDGCQNPFETYSAVYDQTTTTHLYAPILDIPPTRPKRSDFPKLPLTRSARMSFEGFQIYLDNKTRSFHWYVEENNRAVEDAHKHPVATQAFRALSNLKFTRNTGGRIYGDDEYNRDNDYHETYVTFAFGPLGGR